tara:strand:- start:147 stop:1961 length:1815 start_codon:yes stop_codon:yes gene_type:complete
MKNFKVVTNFKGYIAREDQTNISAGWLVSGSQNVIINASNRVAARKGFKMDGPTSTALTPIVSAFDWETHLGYTRNLRSYTDKLEFRYDDGSSVSWVTLMSGLGSAVDFNYTTFWDETEVLDVMLFVNGTSNIYEWSGATATFASATVNTVTKQGTTTWAEEGFYTTGTRTIVIGGVTATYTGGENTTTLTGVSVDFSATAVGALIHQGVKTTANSSTTGLPPAFKNTLISTLNNEVYIGASDSREVYVSYQNDYTDYSFSIPRAVGQGTLLTLDGVPKAFIPQEDKMYISAGTSQWYVTKFTLSGDLVNESFTVERLKTAPLQGANSQAFTWKVKNKIAFLTNEPTLNLLGRVENITATPENEDISDIIRNDFDTYDFTGGSVAYFRSQIFVAIPAENIVLIFNEAKNYWEAPQIMGISRFYIVDGEIYGHSSSTAESYKLFEGYSDRYINSTNKGNPIDTKALFSFQNFGARAIYKSFDEMYVEGYIQANTDLDVFIKYELDGCGQELQYSIDGTNERLVCLAADDRSLGKQRLGSYSLARLRDSTFDRLPPKFKSKKEIARYDFQEYQFGCGTNDVDQRWELLAFGPNILPATNDTVDIKF